MKKIMCCLMLSCAAGFAKTNLQYTVAQINTSLGYALDNSNTVDRLDALDTFVAGSNGFSNIEYTTDQISNSLENALGWTNAIDRIQTLEDTVRISHEGLAELVFTNAVVASAFASTNFTLIDLSPWVGTNSAIVMLGMEPTSPLAAEDSGEFYSGNAEVLDDIYEGAGFCWLKEDFLSTVIVNTSTNGQIRAKTSDPVDISITTILRKRSEP